MAPKAKAPVKAAKATVAKAKPKGLQLSAAQWKAYNAAYSAYATAAYKTLAAQQRQQAINAAVLSLRNSRLQAAYTMQKKTAAAHAAARTAAIAAYAVKQSFRQSQLAHQNAALQNRIHADFQRHVVAAARLQYIYKGEKSFLHTSVMRTLDTAQALPVIQAQFAAAVKTAKAAVASTKPGASSAASAAIADGARAAGLTAASAVPRSQQFAAVNAAAKAKAHQTAHNTASATAKATIAARKKGIKKVTPAPRTAPRPSRYCHVAVSSEWHGDPDGYDCVAAAIANSYQVDTGRTLTGREYRLLATGLGEAPALEFALRETARMALAGAVPLVEGYYPDNPQEPRIGHVIGFQAERGAHAALYLSGGLVLSWGQVLPLRDIMLPGTEVEEAWDLHWAGAVE